MRQARIQSAGGEATLTTLPSDPGDLMERGLIPTRNGSRWQCPACSGDLGTDGTWQAGSLRTTQIASEALASLGVRVRERSETAPILSTYICPSCGTLLRVDITVQSRHG